MCVIFVWLWLTASHTFTQLLLDFQKYGTAYTPVSTACPADASGQRRTEVANNANEFDTNEMIKVP